MIEDALSRMCDCFVDDQSVGHRTVEECRATLTMGVPTLSGVVYLVGVEQRGVRTHGAAG